MLSDQQFADLMSQTRRGDQDAARELVRMYEPEIRRAARLRLTDPEMRRIVDSGREWCLDYFCDGYFNRIDWLDQ